ncbi:MAG: hypothetical protein WA323_21095 [Candidatus Nitrosopolaris sp.]
MSIVEHSKRGITRITKNCLVNTKNCLVNTKNHSHDEHFAFSEDFSISHEVTRRFGFDELNLLNWASK